jgi:hypothetical protein
MAMRPRFPPTQAAYYPMRGGLDLVSPRISIDPGRVFDAQNYEPWVAGGYRRINGFERFDGQTSPTSATYWYMTASITGNVTTAATLTGATSGATGRVLASDTGVIVLGRVSGTFQSGEALQISGVTVATATSSAVESGAPSPSDDANDRLLAANDRRADILAVPGSGAIRGGFVLNDVCYVFRDNAGGTAGALYKQTASGWSQVTFGRELQFDGATGQISDGDTVTGALSGATGVVKRALLRTGTWTASGVGSLVFASITGAFQDNENLQVGGVTKAVANGVDTAITRQPGGRVEVVVGNFTGSSTTKYAYGADGVNVGFEFDGTTYVPIRTGMTSDTPTHVAVHKARLFWAFASSLQYSGINQPYSYTLLTGANEIGVGDAITAIVPQAGNASGASLGVFTSGKTSILYGSTNTDFNLVPSVYDMGYHANTVQPVSNNTYGLTARGVQSLITTLNYGDFQFSALSFLVQPLLEQKQGLQCASVTLKAKNQYRLFFTDGTGLVFGLTGEQLSGILPLNYGMPVRCAWTATLSTGEEVCFFGSDDGYVYKDNVGTSFDGEPIEAWIRPVFNNLKSPRVRKQYRSAVLEASCDGYAEINLSYDLGYASSDLAPVAIQQDQAIGGGGGYWEQFTWEAFTWDAPVVAEPRISIDGTENNISLLVYSNRAQDDSHVIEGANLLYTPRRLTR